MISPIQVAILEEKLMPVYPLLVDFGRGHTARGAEAAILDRVQLDCDTERM